jgi:hypothetical protein
MQAPLARVVAVFLGLSLLASCGGGGGGGGNSSPTSPTVITPGAGTEEISPNPQTWTLLPDLLTLPTYGPGFHPTKTTRVNGILRTYYVRADGFIGYAESTDGQNFGLAVATNIQRVTSQGDLRNGLDHPSVIQRTDGKFLMVYDYVTDNSSNFAKRLVARVSNDGMTFGEAVLMPASAMDNSPGGGTPFQGVTGLINMPDGSIRAYYTAGGAWVGSARTTDGGATWTEDAGYRLTPSVITGGFGDVGAIQDVDGTILLYVHYTTDFGCPNGGGSVQGCQQIRMARSTDGLNFKVYAGNILAPPTGTSEYDDPDVFITPSGRWRMLFGDASRTAGNKLRIADRQ